MFWHQEDLLAVQFVNDDIEMLQTDIQRFIAILGFCLMAIFALVQSIPVTVQESQNIIEDLSKKVINQQKDFYYLKEENRKLQFQLEKLKKETIDLKKVKKKLDLAQKKIVRQGKDLDRLLSEKIDDQQDMIKYRTIIDQREKEIRLHKQEKNKINQLLQKIQAITSPNKNINSKIKSKEIPQQKNVETKKQETYVAFDSNQAFINLLNNKKIYLYIKISGVDKPFEVLYQQSGFIFIPNDPKNSLDLWQISENMVPSIIMKEFKNWTTLSSREKMLIVGLSINISKQIRNKNNKNGRFIINSYGTVNYSQFEE